MAFLFVLMRLSGHLPPWRLVLAAPNGHKQSLRQPTALYLPAGQGLGTPPTQPQRNITCERKAAAPMLDAEHGHRDRAAYQSLLEST